MKTLKKILLSLLIALSMGAVSTVAFAEASDGRISYSASEGVNLLEGKILDAIEGITKGADPEQASKLIKAASDSSKEVNANDKVDVLRQKVNSRLKSARGQAKDGNIQEAEALLREALKMTQEMRGLL
jgi:hypothetical protein